MCDSVKMCDAQMHILKIEVSFDTNPWWKLLSFDLNVWENA